MSHHPKHNKSLCKGKSTSKPNKCIKVRGCKTAKGTQRNFCRKRHNKSLSKKNITVKKKKRFLSEPAQLMGYNKKQERTLKLLGAL